MKKGVKSTLVLFLFLAIVVILSQQILADEIEDSIKKITYQAEQYEAGNINYAQLIVYTTSLRFDLIKAMGASFEQHDPVLKAEQLERTLGKPTENAKWVWVEEGNGNGYEKRLENEVPAWRKLIFDGRKIQMWLGAWPNIVTRNNEDILFYRLHLDIRFKSPEEQLNIKDKIDEIKSLADKYSESYSREDLEVLAEKSVAIEQSFNNFFNQNPSQCRELMNDVLGAENKREVQKLILWEINLYEGDNFDAMMRFEMCDDCNWNWINLNMWIEGRGRDFNYQEQENSNDFGFDSKERYLGLTTEEFRQETKRMIDEIKNLIESGNYQSAMEKSNELRILTEAWNEQANNVWEIIDQKYKNFWETMSEEEKMKCSETYCWIKKEQERRAEESSLRKANFDERKNFYIELFSGYEKKEFYYEQEQWEKRLVEEFKEFGEEMCSNNVDDNENGQVDCSDSQCGGKICGYGTTTIVDENNQTIEQETALYCIAGNCQMREEIVQERTIICGNHICEENEQETCAEDCIACVKHEPLQCEGNIIFSGTDQNGCPLNPICLSEDLSCEKDEDCVDPLCGDAFCIEGTCQITKLTECREAECIDGEEKINHCSSGEDVVVEGCLNGLWIKTGVECEEGAVEIEAEAEVEEVGVVGDECVVKSDCGNENDVCSNGRCVIIPQSEETEIILQTENEIREFIGSEETEETPLEETEEIQEETSPEEIGQEPETQEVKEETVEQTEDVLTGNVIFSFFKTLAGTITGFATGDGTDSGDGGEEGSSGESNTGETTESGSSGEQVAGETSEVQGPQENSQENLDEQREQQEREEDERRENECNERCDRECYDREVRPCVEDCIFEGCGQELECNVDEVRVNCETTCKEETSLDSCVDECSEKCLKGEDTWVEPEREEHKEEKFVFTVGGSCREAQGKTEGFIWFGGWTGDRTADFNDFHLIKNKYYSHGGREWCEEDLENLVKQRKELEKSLNEEFAMWFFEKYVANSAEKWNEHISGIFELYWRDVDLSRQITERLGCLNKDTLPPHELINFKYETDYGSVEFWEEVRTTNEFGEEKEIISPYMRTWLFPSREFFKFEMKKSMENHELPGPSEEERSNTLSEEEKQDLRNDDEFMDEIRNFNEKYGENFVLQLKDFETGEIAFNVYMRINENELIYTEPMPPEQNPGDDVKAELDVNKLLDIIEFEESGRVELQSPPWDRRQEQAFVKNVVDGARMYFMFSSLMNSLVSTPGNADGSAKFFTRQFFERVMGGDREDEKREGPGGCTNEEECREYCENPNNQQECSQFMEENGQPESWENKASLTGQVIG